MDKELTTGQLLQGLFHQMERAADALLEEQLNISYKRAYVLFMTHYLRQPSQIELAKALGYSRASVTTMLARLCGSGYVTISDHPAHGKRRIVGLTPRGYAVVSEGAALLNREFSQFISTAGVDEENYRELTERLYIAFQVKNKE